MKKISAAEIKELEKIDTSDLEELALTEAAKEMGISIEEAKKLMAEIDSGMYDSCLTKEEKIMKPTGHTEGTLRNYVLLKYQKEFPFRTIRLKAPSSWHPIGIGIQVPKNKRGSGGSIDILFMNRQSDLLIAEVKKRENTERGPKPIKQLLRYAEGLKEIASFDKFYKKLTEKEDGTEKWKDKRRKSYERIPQPDCPACHVSNRFEKAMKQLFGSKFGHILKKAFEKMKRGYRPAMVVIQNHPFHQKTARVIGRYRKKGNHIWGLEIPYPENRDKQWHII